MIGWNGRQGRPFRFYEATTHNRPVGGGEEIPSRSGADGRELTLRRPREDGEMVIGRDWTIV